MFIFIFFEIMSVNKYEVNYSCFFNLILMLVRDTNVHEH